MKKIIILLLILISVNSYPLNQKDAEKYLRMSVGKVVGLVPYKKHIVLTIDDGPSKYTPKILEILREREIKANFYLVGKRIPWFPKYAKEIKKEGHRIGSHSYNHPNLNELNEKELLDKEIIPFEKTAKKYGLGEINTIRPPYGALNPDHVLTLRKRGYTPINWNLDSFDWKYSTEKSFEKIINSKYKNGGIILVHSSAKSLKLLPKLLDELVKEGYTFTTIEDYIDMRKNLK